MSDKDSSANASVEIDACIPREIAPSRDLTTLAERGALSAGTAFCADPSYESAIELLSRSLRRKSSRHALLIGERGVGLEIVVGELARRALDSQSPLHERRFIFVDARHTDPLECRDRLLAILAHTFDQERLVVAIDGFGGLMRSKPEGAAKVALLSALHRVRSRVVGLASPAEYEETLANDADIRIAFERIDVAEPEPASCIRFLAPLVERLETEYRVEIDDEAVRQAVMLTANYVMSERLPEKALRTLRRACEEIDFARQAEASVRSLVDDRIVADVVSQETGVPPQTLLGIAERCDFEAGLEEEIVGQPHAIRTVSTELKLIKGGFADPGKPASVMMFVGPTGTGKTETAKALARFYSASKRLRTYTLGNFVESHSVAGIVGPPPGYVGHENGGRIVQELHADPYSVFLFDEADKAHPDVLQPLLNLFDEGWIRDQRGTVAYADRSIFILTTNVGQRMIVDLAKQGKTPEEIADRMRESLSQIRHGKSNRPVFTPEFLARIKRLVVFQPLDSDAMRGICKKLVRRARSEWSERRRKELDVPDWLIDAIADEARRRNDKTEGREGGRIVRKLMLDWLDAPLQKAAADDPEAYRECRRIAFKRGEGGGAQDGISAVRIEFQSRQFASAAPHPPVPAESIEFQA